MTVEEVEQYYCTVEPGTSSGCCADAARGGEAASWPSYSPTPSTGPASWPSDCTTIGIDAKEIHGDLEQRKRDRVMERFRKHRFRVLVATDLAARGIDVQQHHPHHQLRHAAATRRSTSIASAARRRMGAGQGHHLRHAGAGR